MPRFIELTNSEKNELLLRASSVTKISPILLEKDFWVSWLLNNIFRMDLAKDLMFKGGTSLSKCYGLIQRFSEDIDITIDKSIFSGGVADAALSGKQFQKLLSSNDQKAINFIQTQFRSQLEGIIATIIPGTNQWQLASEEGEAKNLRFYYPSAVTAADNTYVKQSVLIEIGVRGEVFPCEDKTVQSYVEAQFPDILFSEQTTIKTLSPVRTFWEKITLLHAENNRPADKDPGDRLSRHYYDTHQMIKAGIGEQALNNLDLLHDVIKNKSRYFRSSWANYDEAVPGSLKIYPHAKLLPYLETDYKNMRSMIFGEVPTFTDVAQSVEEFEVVFNNLLLPRPGEMTSSK